MKNILLMSALALVLSLCSCKEKDIVLFTQPQPADMKNLAGIPRKFHGVFKSISDSTTVSISKSLILVTIAGDITLHPDDLSDNEYLSGDYLHDRNSSLKLPFTAVGDSIKVRASHSDTLFDLQNAIARKFAGSLFLSKEDAPGRWSVKKMSRNGNALTIDRISSSEIDEMPFEQINIDSIGLPHYSASKSQFKSYVRKGGFKDRQEYERVN